MLFLLLFMRNYILTLILFILLVQNIVPITVLNI